MSVLRDLQALCGAQLTAQGPLSSIPIILQDDKDIANTIATAVGKIGICSVVVTPSASPGSPDYPLPWYNSIKILVRTFELPTINRLGSSFITAYDAAELITLALHGFTPPNSPGSGIQDINTTIYTVPPGLNIVPDKTYVVYDTHFQTQMGIDNTSRPVLPATIAAVTGGTLTASNTQPGAAIFYTTDATKPANPSPASPTATLYTGAVTGIPSGTLIRVRAWLWGFVPSPEIQLTA